MHKQDPCFEILEKMLQTSKNPEGSALFLGPLTYHLSRKRNSIFCGLFGYVHTSREVNEARLPHTCSRPCAFEEKKFEKKNAKKSAPPKTHHEIHSSPATASNSRRHARKHVPSVSPYSPASMDPEFVEIGLVQHSQSVKTTYVTRTHTDRLTK